ncbi:hypothetical protein MRX96_031461 [Rhipicephalus microplus]
MSTGDWIHEEAPHRGLARNARNLRLSVRFHPVPGKRRRMRWRPLRLLVTRGVTLAGVHCTRKRGHPKTNE